jgi:hypothetical protein
MVAFKVLRSFYANCGYSVQTSGMTASNITKDVRGVQRVPASVMNPTFKTAHIQDIRRHHEYTQEHQDNISNKRDTVKTYR